MHVPVHGSRAISMGFIVNDRITPRTSTTTKNGHEDVRRGGDKKVIENLVRIIPLYARATSGDNADRSSWAQRVYH